MHENEPPDSGEYLIEKLIRIPRPSRIARNLGLGAAGLAVAGASAMGVILVSKDYIFPSFFNDDGSTGYVTLDERYGSLLRNNEEAKESVIEDYQTARRHFIGENKILLRTHKGQETNESVNSTRQLYVRWGLDIINEFFLEGDIQFDQDSSKVDIEGYRQFDLDNVYDAVILDQFINLTIDSKTNDNPVEKLRLEKELEDIKWLINSDLAVTVNSDAFGFPENKVFVTMSRFYRIIEDLKYPISKRIIFEAFDPVDDYLDDGLPIAGQNRNGTSVIKGNASKGVPVHEEIHTQAIQNNSFTLDVFNSVLEAAFFEAELRGENIDVVNTFISKYPLTKKTPASISSENLPEIMDEYFIDGIGFRDRLKELKVSNFAEYKILKEQYDFAGLFYGGLEFIQSGEIFDPELGDVFEISDPQEDQRGVQLRLVPQSQEDLSFPQVFDGDSVIVLDGPVSVASSDTDAKQMWFVQKVVTGENGEFDLSEGSGWVERVWLGIEEIPVEISGYLIDK